ncbi:MAG TPA: hypothetical protein VF970_16835 [Gemmatimonadales bacterium]
MRLTRLAAPVFGLFFLAACEGPRDLPVEPQMELSGNGVQSLVTGQYTANIGAVAPIIAEFNLDGRIDRNGQASGGFTFFTETSTGTIDFAGEITCLPFNDDLGRAWIGAVITRNSSTRPTHDGTLEIHRVGHDVWFRVADRSPGGSGAPDRTTSIGFEGSAGIGTSAEYCALQIWPNDGAPVLSGNLTVR